MTFDSAAVSDVGFKRARVLRYMVEMRYEYVANHIVGRQDEVPQSWRAVLTKAMDIVSAWMRGARDEDREVIAYRAAIKLLIIGGVRYRKRMNWGGSAYCRKGAQKRDTTSRNLMMKEVTEGVVPDTSDVRGLKKFVCAVGWAFPMLSQIYSYACRILPYDGKDRKLLDTRLYQLYISLCDRDGVVDKLVGERRRVKYLNPHWNWQKYYGGGMFSIEPKSRSLVAKKGENFEAAIFMQMVRLYVDARSTNHGIERGMLIRCGKRGTKRARDFAAKETNGVDSQKWGNIENTAFGVETVVNAWTIFAHLIGFKSVSDFCSDLLVYDEADVILRVIPETRCRAVNKEAGKLELLCINEKADVVLRKNVMERLGVCVWSNEVSDTVQVLRNHEKEFRFWRKCVSDFVNDLNMIGESANLMSQNDHPADSVPELEPFQVIGRGIMPERFKYDESKVQRLRQLLIERNNDEKLCMAEKRIKIAGEKAKHNDNCERWAGVVCVQRFPQSVLYIIAALTSESEFVSVEKSMQAVDEYNDAMRKALNRVELASVLGATLAQYRMILGGKNRNFQTGLEGCSTLVTLRDIAKGALVGYSYGMFIRKTGTCEMNVQRIGEMWFEITNSTRQYCGLSVVPLGDAFNIGYETFTDLIHVPAKHCPFRYAKYDSRGIGNVRAENIRIRPTTSLDSLKSHCFLSMRAVKCIKAGQEIIVCKDVNIKCR